MFIEKYKIRRLENPLNEELADLQTNQYLGDFIRYKLYRRKSPLTRIIVSPMFEMAGYDVIFLYEQNYDGEEISCDKERT